MEQSEKSGRHFSEPAKKVMRNHGAFHLLISFGLLVVASVISGLSGSETTNNNQSFILMYAAWLFILSNCALFAFCGCCGTCCCSGPQEPTPEVESNYQMWRKEGCERFWAWMGLSIYNLSEVVGYCVVAHSILTFILEVVAIVNGRYQTNIGDYPANAPLFTRFFFKLYGNYYGRAYPIVNVVFSLIQTAVIIIQLFFAHKWKPNDSQYSGTEFGKNLIARADCLGAFLSFEMIVVTLYNFSSSDWWPSGPYSNFSLVMLSIDGPAWKNSKIFGFDSGGTEPRFQIAKLFFGFAVGFASLFQFMLFLWFILLSCMTIKTETTIKFFQLTITVAGVACLGVMALAVFSEVIYFIISATYKEGFLRNLVVRGSEKYCWGTYDVECEAYETKPGVLYFTYYMNYIVPLFCAGFCIFWFVYKLLRITPELIPNWMKTFTRSPPGLAQSGSSSTILFDQPSYPAEPGKVASPSQFSQPQQQAQPQTGYPPPQQNYPSYPLPSQQGGYASPQQGGYPSPQRGGYPSPQQGGYPPPP